MPAVMADIGEEDCEQRANRKDPQGLTFCKQVCLKGLPFPRQTVNHRIIHSNCITLNCQLGYTQSHVSSVFNKLQDIRVNFSSPTAPQSTFAGLSRMIYLYYCTNNSQTQNILHVFQVLCGSCLHMYVPPGTKEGYVCLKYAFCLFRLLISFENATCRDDTQNHRTVLGHVPLMPSTQTGNTKKAHSHHSRQQSKLKISD